MQSIKFVILAIALLSPLVTIARGSSGETTMPDHGSNNHVLPPGDPPKIMVGEVEDVLLIPWTILLPARIDTDDTDATLSALDARNLAVENNVADFTLGNVLSSLLGPKLPAV